MTVNTVTGEITESPTPYQLLPRLTDEEYEALKADIAEFGVRTPIDVDEFGTIIDGHHRAWICADLGVECPRRMMPNLTDEQKRAHALAVNVFRRNLSGEQRRELILRLRSEGMSTRTIGQLVDVDHSTVVRAIESAPDLAVSPGADAPRHTVTGQDGKTYAPATLDERREWAAHLRNDQGMSIGQIAESMGIAKSSAQTLLAPRKPRTEKPKAPSRPAHLYGTQHLNSNRIIGKTAEAYINARLGDLASEVEWAQLDRKLIPEWIESLSESQKALSSLLRRLREELNRG